MNEEAGLLGVPEPVEPAVGVEANRPGCNQRPAEADRDESEVAELVESDTAPPEEPAEPEPPKWNPHAGKHEPAVPPASPEPPELPEPSVAEVT
ncbi:MAG TPA: hypothetical protein VGH89_04860 [Pseudonocardia sp.]|jgi:hypothetical protein